MTMQGSETEYALIRPGILLVGPIQMSVTYPLIIS